MPEISCGDVEYHRQDEAYLAGAACVQTLLRKCGDATNRRQTDLHNEILADSGQWQPYAGPFGLSETLNKHAAVMGRHFLAASKFSPFELTQRVAKTCRDFQMPPAVLVMGGPVEPLKYGDVLVVTQAGTGLNVRNAPAGPTILTSLVAGDTLTFLGQTKSAVLNNKWFIWYRIRTVNNVEGWSASASETTSAVPSVPWLEKINITSSENLPRGTWVLVKRFVWQSGDVVGDVQNANLVRMDIHHPHGGWPAKWVKPAGYADVNNHVWHRGCECGTGIVPNTKTSWGQRHQAVTLDEWIAHWLKSPVGSWAGGSYAYQYLAICDPKEEDPGSPEEELGLGDGSLLKDLEEVKWIAWQGLNDYGLMAEPEWQAAHLGSAPGDPQLVERLDAENLHYYVVPWIRDNTVPLIATVDALGRYGLGGSVAIPDGSAAINEWWTRQMVVDYWVNTVKHWPVKGYDVPLRESDLSEHLVWTPCMESGYNLDVPFWRFNVGGGDFEIFIRIDGEIYTELTAGIN